MAEEPELLSAKAFAVRRIRALIHSGEFDADGKLSIAALSQQLGVSRTPVRDALWQLACEGLVTVSPRVGAFLRRVTPREAADIYRLKEAIEPLMAGWAAIRADAQTRAGYLKQVKRLCEVAETGDTEQYVVQLESCRASLLSMAASPPLAEILSVIDGRVRLLRFKNLSQSGQLVVSASQHWQVAQAIAAGDEGAAMQAMAAHMQDATRRVQRLAQGPHGSGDYWLSMTSQSGRQDGEATGGPAPDGPATPTMTARARS